LGSGWRGLNPVLGRVDNQRVRSRRVTPGGVLLLALLVAFVILLLPRHVRIQGHGVHLRPGWAPYLPYIFG
jgi:hypothetical protein